MTTKLNRRVQFGLLLLLLTIAIVGGVRIASEQPSPTQKTYTFGEATLFFETDRTTVWQIGDCVNLRWEAQNIQAIYLNRQPTVGERTMLWCAEQQEATPFFTINLPDGTVKYLAPFQIATVRARIILTLIPLLIIAGWCFGLHRLLAHSFAYLPTPLRVPFSVSGKVQPLLVVLFIGVNAIVVWNAITIRAAMGYDVEGHYANAVALSQGHLPTPQESAEFFSPPLPYILPALVNHLPGADAIGVQKAGQLQNILVSLITTFLILRMGARLYPDKLNARALALFLLGTLPVYYKSFAFMRGEPFVVMFTLLLCDHFLTLLGRKPALWDGLIIGVYGGLMLLSRQWGALVLAGVGGWWLVLVLRQHALAMRLIRPGIVGGVIAMMLGGWFYLALATQSGTVLAFNRQADNIDKPASFFTGLGGQNLVVYPYSPGYDGQAIPIFYTEIWGDYFGYFYLQRPPIPSRFPLTSLSYLGSVNITGAIPTLLLLAGFIYGGIQLLKLLAGRFTLESTMASLFTICVASSFVGFIWFLARYPSHDADTAKATYLLHIFPLLCLLAASMLEKMEQRYPRLFRGIWIALIVIAGYSFPAFFSRIN